MSKISRKRNKEKRAAKKRAKKASKKALYASFAASGQNKKSKRFVSSSKKKKLLSNKAHQVLCGNIACKTCYPTLERKRKFGSTIPRKSMRKKLNKIK